MYAQAQMLMMVRGGRNHAYSCDRDCIDSQFCDSERCGLWAVRRAGRRSCSLSKHAPIEDQRRHADRCRCRYDNASVPLLTAPSAAAAVASGERSVRGGKPA